MNTDVLIIGGGLMGFSSALQLAMRGQRCVVLEQDSPGRHASGVNAGGLRRLNRAVAEIPLALEAANMWRDMRALVGADCDARFPGQLRVAENEQDMVRLEQREKLVSNLGYTHEQLVSKNQLYKLVPALANHCVGALYCEGDGYARPFHTLEAFRQKAGSLGVEHLSGVTVTGVSRVGQNWEVSTSEGQFRAAVLLNCAGAWAGKVAAWAGEPVPLVPKAPMMMVTERLPHFIDPVIGAASRKLSFKQMQNGTLLIGGAHLAELDLDTQQTRMNWPKLSVSARSALALFPQIKDVRIVRCWAGIEGFMPDNLPVIGPSSTMPKLYHAFGFSAHGFQLSPVVGRIMAEMVLDGQASLPVEAFHIGRFRARRDVA